ncbi:UNVERIFIED_CONTAM: hypothetical protein NCL1_58990 [Trichonephila clavipes]
MPTRSASSTSKNAWTPSTPWPASTASSPPSWPPFSSDCSRNWRASMPTTRPASAWPRNWPPTPVITRRRPPNSAHCAAAPPSAWPQPSSRRCRHWACPAGVSASSCRA